MKKIKYLIQRIIKMDHTRMLETSKKVHKISGKNQIIVFIDMIYSGLKYKSGYTDYLNFRFYEIDAKKRETFITRGYNNDLNNLYNQKTASYVLDDKFIFLETFKDLVGRDFMKVEKDQFESFERFFNLHSEIIAKPLDSMCGEGISFYRNNSENVTEVFEKLTNKDPFIIEEVIQQHPKMSQLNPDSVNSIRIYTLRKDEKAEVMFAACRIGSGKRVDNFHAGGMIVKIDLESGQISSNANNQELESFTQHPITKTEFIGFEIPYFQEAKEITLKAALRLNNLNYVGWDVAITTNGPILIEGNTFPAHDMIQFPELVGPEKIGLKPKYKETLSKLNS